MKYFSPKDVFETHIRILKRELRNYTTYTDYLAVEKWIDDNHRWMAEQTDFQKAQAWAEELQGKEADLVEREGTAGRWEYRVNAVCDYLQDTRRFAEEGRTQDVLDMLDMLTRFARTGRMYEEKPDEDRDGQSVE